MLFGQWWGRWRRWGSRSIAAYAVVLAASGVLLAPAVMPVLPPAVFAQVYHPSGSGGADQQSGDAYGLPQSLADRFG